MLQGSTGGTPVDLEPTTIGGKEAVGVEIKWTNANDFDVHQIAYLVISGDEQFSITASFAQGTPASRTPTTPCWTRGSGKSDGPLRLRPARP